MVFEVHKIEADVQADCLAFVRTQPAKPTKSLGNICAKTHSET
jgi:hypothetical protein